MKIGILGTRGIPNHYGGFEQFAEYLSIGLVERNHEVVVYNSSLHPYKSDTWKGVKIVQCKDFENKIGSIGQFVYDFNCILNARNQDFDILLQLGYTSNSIWHKLLPKKPTVITNMDGLEWKRNKYNALTKMFLRYAESWAINSSDHLVSDSIGIQTYLFEKFKKPSTYIPYGSRVFENPNSSFLKPYKLVDKNYFLLIARMEPENNIETILDGYVISKSALPFIVIGSFENSFGKYLKEKFSAHEQIHFIGPIYDIEVLNNLRYYSKLYFHGHSVGGTNPSLLEAMGSSSLIVAHDNEFNKAVLADDAYYFNTSAEVANIIQSKNPERINEESIQRNFQKIQLEYNWSLIIDKYEDLFLKFAK